MNKNALPPSLVANLEQVLISRKASEEELQPTESMEAPISASSPAECAAEAGSEETSTKPVILVTNADGIESAGLVCLVESLVRDGRFDVHVCAPQFDKSASGHSFTVRETVEVSSIEISGATAYEVSGTPADCVSLALSGALFSWSKPVLVISGINRGSNCGHNMLYSGAIAGAREALICGVPSVCISLNCKKDASSENDFKGAVDVCLPLVYAVISAIEKGVFPKSCLLNMEVPVYPSANKGLRITRQSMWRNGLSWLAVSSYRHPASGHFMGGQQSLGIQLAQLSRDASAAGAARRIHTNKKNLEVESVGVAGKPSSKQAVKKHFRLELQDEVQEDADEDLDFKAVENGFIAVTPLALSSELQPEIQSSVSDWFAVALSHDD